MHAQQRPNPCRQAQRAKTTWWKPGRNDVQPAVAPPDPDPPQVWGMSRAHDRTAHAAKTCGSRQTSIHVTDSNVTRARRAVRCWCDNQLPPPHALQGRLAVLRMPEIHAHPQQSPAVGVDQYHEHAVCHSADPARDATGLRCHVFADNQPANPDRSHVPHDSRVLPSQEGGRGHPIQQTRTLQSQNSAVGAIGPLGLWHSTDKQGCNRSDDDDGIAPCGSPLTVHRDSTGLSRRPFLVPPRQGKPTERKAEAQPTVRCPEEPDAGRIVRKVADKFRADVRRGHANLVAYVLDSTPATNRWYGGRDLFANVGVEAAQKGHNIMEIKFWGKRVSNLPAPARTWMGNNTC